MNVYSNAKNRLVAVVFLLACVGAAGAAWAQPSRAPWWKDDKSKAELKLTDEQSSQIEAIFKESWQKMRSSYEELGKREEQLSALVSASDTTEADVVRQVEQVEAVRSELNKVRTVMLYRMHRILNPEQRAKLDDLRRQHDRDRSRGGSRPPRGAHPETEK